jgi:GNAT superfamily N-acetyltransferase
MISLRRARPAEAAALAELSKQAFDSDADYGAPGPGGPPGYDSAEWQAHMMRMGEYHAIVSDGVLVGGAIVFRKGPREYDLGRIFIGSQWQNCGIGEQAMEQLLRLYPLAKRWTLDTPAWNARTRHFYAKMGFGEIGEDGHGGVQFERVMG